MATKHPKCDNVAAALTKHPFFDDIIISLSLSIVQGYEQTLYKWML